MPEVASMPGKSRWSAPFLTLIDEALLGGRLVARRARAQEGLLETRRPEDAP